MTFAWPRIEDRTGDAELRRRLNQRMRDLEQALAGKQSSLDWINVKRDFGVTGAGTAADIARMQAAIDAGGNDGVLYWEPGNYYGVGLTSSYHRQLWLGNGQNTRLIKNGNGVIATFSGDDVILRGLSFRGDAVSPTYTGDNVNASGANFSMLECESRWAYGRAVKATGAHTQIRGTCGIYQTADATATGYDIEIGVSGTSTLYHMLEGIYSSQSTGGIKLIDTGSHTILGGQFGKLSIVVGTGPAGVNGGKTVGARILGDVTVNVSSAILTGNQFGIVAITFGASTSGCVMDATNTYQVGATITNSGNANNVIVKQVSTGSTQAWRFGDDSSTAVLEATPSSGQFSFPERVEFQNNKTVAWRNAADNADAGSVVASAANNFGFTALIAALQLTGKTLVQLVVDATERLRAHTTGVTAYGTIDNDSTITAGTDLIATGTITANHASNLSQIKSGNFLVGNNTITPASLNLALRSEAGKNRALAWQTGAGLARWLLRANSTAESGSDAGSNFDLYRYDDAGSTATLVFLCNRATGEFTFSNDIGAAGGFAHTCPGWYQDNVAASQTNVELTNAQGRWTAVRAGSVLGVVVHATEARTAGTLTVDVYKNTGLAGAAGSSIGLTAVLDGTNTSRKATTQAKDTDTFAAGDELYAVVTTDGSWTPTTSDIRVSILVEC